MDEGQIARHAHSIFVEETKARKEREEADITTVRPVFIPMTPERLREAANAIRKRQGLPPLP